MNYNIITESNYLSNNLNLTKFNEIFNQKLTEFSNQKFSDYMDFSHFLSIFLNQFTKLGIFTDGKLIKTDSFGHYTDFTWVQLYQFPNYFLVVATYVGSCDGCIRNRYEDNSNQDLPSNIKTEADALLFYKNDILNVYNNIILKSTIINNKNEALSEFQSIKEKIQNDENIAKSFD